MLCVHTEFSHSTFYRIFRQPRCPNEQQSFPSFALGGRNTSATIDH
jgi:hypothetical protein